MNLRFHPKDRPGLTLIELVVVMVILAAIAALVIPKLGFLQDQATSISGAAGSADLANNLETYKVTTGFYPLRFDSLTDGTNLITQLWAHPGPPGSGPFTVSTLGSATDFSSLESWGHSFGDANGNYTIMDQDTGATTDPSSSFNTLRPFKYDGSDKVVIVDPTNGSSIWQAAGYPTVVSAATAPTGVTLVALGVGPQCSSIGRTMMSPPLQTGQTQNVYGRFVAIFAVYGTTGDSTAGKSAELKVVLDSFFQPVNSNIKSFRQAAPVNQ